MTTFWAVPMYKLLGYRDTILDKYEPLKVRSIVEFLEFLKDYTKIGISGIVEFRQKIRQIGLNA